MVRRDSERDAERPHYYTQIWLDVASGRRNTGLLKPDEKATISDNSELELALEPEAPIPSVATVEIEKSHQQPIKIFICYAHEDELLFNQLKIHLRSLQRSGLIDVWNDRDINAGTEWESKIDKHLNTAQIILLLVSPDFMNSDYCYGTEMKRAIERHEQGEAKVIPVILRPVHWHITQLNKLQALPTDAKPVKSWPDLDEAFLNVSLGIYKIIVELAPKPPADVTCINCHQYLLYPNALYCPYCGTKQR